MITNINSNFRIELNKIKTPIKNKIKKIKIKTKN